MIFLIYTGILHYTALVICTDHISNIKRTQKLTFVLPILTFATPVSSDSQAKQTMLFTLRSQLWHHWIWKSGVNDLNVVRPVMFLSMGFILARVSTGLLRRRQQLSMRRTCTFHITAIVFKLNLDFCINWDWLTTPTGCPKKFANRMLLEPCGTCSILDSLLPAISTGLGRAFSGNCFFVVSC